MSESKHRKEDEESRSIAFECDLPEPPDKVWRALTTPEFVSEWLLPTDLVPEAGEKFAFRDSPETEIECEVLSVEPQRSISFGWRDAEARRNRLNSTVTFEIAGTDRGGTHLRIVHEVRYEAQAVTAIATIPRVTATAANDNLMQLRLAA
ncbi:SRPBCC domain-containing protein [Mesorhizobium sp. BAC0120]|uniref:SRPBCC family protein n=1 Tax=Mesorhizobium sp. BAC0120 TaxID=3090670 RepID=UPI00298C08C6|nr:SRPBCC domain-containing protein [Mesorhizobium sp. BAC0120]MDW6023669.1 SRPBCC domain-containing protein [Mesorhizobium sp. BAC0120]